MVPGFPFVVLRPDSQVFRLLMRYHFSAMYLLTLFYCRDKIRCTNSAPKALIREAWQLYHGNFWFVSFGVSIEVTPNKGFKLSERQNS